MGSIYQRGNVYWIKYYRAGKRYQESSKSTKESDAIRLLKRREGDIVANRFFGLKPEKVRYEELAEDFLNDYKANSSFRRTSRQTTSQVFHSPGAFSASTPVFSTSVAWGDGSSAQVAPAMGRTSPARWAFS